MVKYCWHDTNKVEKEDPKTEATGEAEEDKMQNTEKDLSSDRKYA